MNKRGLSTVIAVLLIVLLTVVSVVIIYGVVSTMIRGKLDDTKKCGPEILDKVTLNKRYTCFYNRTIIQTTGTTCDLSNINTKCVNLNEIKNCYIDSGAIDGFCYKKHFPPFQPCGAGYTIIDPDNSLPTSTNDEYCAQTNGFQYVSINVGDIVVDKVIVTIGDGITTKDYEIVEGDEPASNKIYNYAIGEIYFDGIETNLPDENPSDDIRKLKLVKKQGRTYVIKPGDLPTLNYKPQQVRVTPVIGSKRCGVADQVLEIPSCDPDFGFPVLFSTP